MRDNQIFAIIVPLIRSALVADAAFSSVVVKQSYQPTQQGTPTGSAVFLHKLGDRRYGSPHRANVWDAIASKMIYTETEIMETSFQVDALAIQNPSNLLSITASDIVNRVATILQSQATIDALLASGLSVMRIGEIRNPQINDDRDNFEAAPSFDFILQHETATITEAEILTTTEYAIKRV